MVIYLDLEGTKTRPVAQPPLPKALGLAFHLPPVTDHTKQSKAKEWGVILRFRSRLPTIGSMPII